MNEKIRILCVDDEPNVLEAMKRTLRTGFEVTTALGGQAAIDAADQNGPFAIVISDLRMPDVDGVAVLKHMNEASPDTVRILLTGQADVPAAIKVVNEGRVFRFLTKPCPSEVLTSVLHAAAEQHRLVTLERVLLEQTLRGSIQALADVVALVHPAVVGRGTRIKRLVLELAEHLQLQDRWVIEVSALLAHVGFITLPAATVEKLHSGGELGREEQELVARVPDVTAKLVAHIPRLEGVREILLHQDARWDGANSSDRAVRGEAIPIGARLLKLASDYDVLESQGLNVAAAVNALAGRTGEYDPQLVALLRELCGGKTASNEVLEMPLADVRVGMVFAGDVTNPAGMMLIARGQEVTDSLLGRIRNYWSGFSHSVRVSVLVGDSHRAGSPIAKPAAGANVVKPGGAKAA